MASKAKTSIFESKGWKTGMKYLYGWGAAVVIIGALFKILHFPGASEMLIVGLGTESVIFFFSAFEPLPPDEAHYNWEKVYPQLAEDEDEEIELPEMDGEGSKSSLMGNLQQTGKILEEAKLEPDFFDKLSESVHGLNVNVRNLADISDATVATNEFHDKLKVASGKIDQMTKGISSSVESTVALSNSLSDVQTYTAQVQAVSKNLASLNSVYELEFQEAQKHINSINQFYGGISSVMQNLLDTSKDTDNLRQEVSSLANNMHALNTVYGNMLNAMAGR